MVENRSPWIHDCLECAALCQAVAEACAGRGADAQAVRSLVAAAAVTELVGELLRDGAEPSVELRGFLAETCERAAAACGSLDAELAGRCVASCRGCAAAARATLEP